MTETPEPQADPQHSSQAGANPEPRRGSTGVTLSRPMIIALLYLLNFAAGFTVIVGVVLAYIWRRDEASLEWEHTHFTYHIRTFWVGFVLFIASMVLFFGTFIFSIPQGSGPPRPFFFIAFFGTFFGWLLMAGWFTVRCILSLVKAADGKPMERPEAWLV